MDNVLCDYDIQRRLTHMAETTGLMPDFIHQAIWESGFDAAADRGEISAADYLAGCARRLNVPLSRQDWVAARAVSMTPNPAVLDIARTVGRSLPIAMFTNNGLLLKAALPESFPDVFGIFGSRVFFSAELGLAKPDPDAFLALAGRLRADPRRVLFIDDSADYIAGARKAGLHTHHFSRIEALRAELTGFGLL
jgi:putative hydrolase of the HAD superfamily